MFEYRYPLLEVIKAIDQLRESRGRTNKEICDFVRKQGKNPNDPMKVLKTISCLNKLVEEGVLVKKGKRYLFPSKNADDCDEQPEDCEEEPDDEEEDCPDDQMNNQNQGGNCRQQEQEDCEEEDNTDDYQNSSSDEDDDDDEEECERQRECEEDDDDEDYEDSEDDTITDDEPECCDDAEDPEGPDDPDADDNGSESKNSCDSDTKIKTTGSDCEQEEDKKDKIMKNIGKTCPKKLANSKGGYEKSGNEKTGNEKKKQNRVGRCVGRRYVPGTCGRNEEGNAKNGNANGSGKSKSSKTECSKNGNAKSGKNGSEKRKRSKAKSVMECKSGGGGGGGGKNKGGEAIAFCARDFIDAQYRPSTHDNNKEKSSNLEDLPQDVKPMEEKVEKVTKIYSARRKESRTRRSQNNICRSRSPIKRPRTDAYHNLELDANQMGSDPIRSQLFRDTAMADMDVDLEKDMDTPGMDFDQYRHRSPVGPPPPNTPGVHVDRKESCCSDFDKKMEVKIEVASEAEQEYCLKKNLESGLSLFKPKVNQNKKMAEKLREKHKREASAEGEKRANEEERASLCSICDKKKRTS